MISKIEIKTIIDEAEKVYLECWDTLLAIRTPDKIDKQDFLNFQPKIAQILFKLDKTYRILHQEKQNYIGRKQKFSPTWFKRRLVLIRKYQDAIKDTIAIGKVLGDAFAWVFYEGEREYLKAHLAHQKNFHVPPGIGGKGELELIKKAPLIGNRLLIYHQLTNFLRIGDVSLFDLKQKRLQALGEIKTVEIEPGKLEIHLSFLGPSNRFEDQPAMQVNDKELFDNSSLSPLPHYFASKLQKQLEEIAQSFNIAKDDGNTNNMYGDVHFHELSQLLIQLKKSSVAYQKVGDGLLLIGMKEHRKALSTRIMVDSSKDIIDKLNDLPAFVQEIVDTTSKDNSIAISSWHIPNPKDQLHLGLMPIFWWPVEPNLIKQIIFREVHIFALFNPIHFISKLQDIGLQIISKDKNYLVTAPNVGRISRHIENFNYFINLIVTYLFEEETVVRIIRDFLLLINSKIESGELPETAIVELSLRQHMGETAQPPHGG
jgi:hypothetical protein